MDRRRFLTAGISLATTVAAPRLSLAAGPAAVLDHRFVLVILRGALDGLAAVAPVGDPHYLALRQGLEPLPEQTLPLDGLFALHPALRFCRDCYGQRQLTIVHAAATGYRQRSHFDAQQVLESGGAQPFDLATGWLNRALAYAGDRQGIALATALPLVLRGEWPVDSWAPSRLPDPDPDLLDRLTKLYAADSGLLNALERARGLRGMSMAEEGARASRERSGFLELSQRAGAFLAQEAGPRIAVLELSGWDTHQRQNATLSARLKLLDDGLQALKETLGPAWMRTVVMVVTEFGRTVRVNGTQGTDHGTGAAALVMGGAIRSGRMVADWPGLAPAALHEGRDLRATTDLRAVQLGVLRDHLGIDSARSRALIFPNSGPLKPLGVGVT